MTLKRHWQWEAEGLRVACDRLRVALADAQAERDAWRARAADLDRARDALEAAAYWLRTLASRRREIAEAAKAAEEVLAAIRSDEPQP